MIIPRQMVKNQDRIHLSYYYRNEMLTKVRQYREQMAKLQNQLKQIADSVIPGNSTGNNDGPDGEYQVGMSAEQKNRQQVMLGTESLERTSQSIAR